jgi:hypothetical protein
LAPENVTMDEAFAAVAPDAKPGAYVRLSATATGTEEEQLEVFRRVRDEMRRVFEAYAAGLRDSATRRLSLPQ